MFILYSVFKYIKVRKKVTVLLHSLFESFLSSKKGTQMPNVPILRLLLFFNFVNPTNSSDDIQTCLKTNWKRKFFFCCWNVGSFLENRWFMFMLTLNVCLWHFLVNLEIFEENYKRTNSHSINRCRKRTTKSIMIKKINTVQIHQPYYFTYNHLFVIHQLEKVFLSMPIIKRETTVKIWIFSVSV